MINFSFFLPTKIFFGKDTHLNVGEYVKQYGGKKVLIHYGGNSAVKTGLLDIIKSVFNENNIEYVLLGGVVPNPRMELVYKGIEICKKNDVDFVLAVGGGSVIDSAKAIAVGVANDCDPWLFFDRQREVEKCLPIGVVLTIAASGSETSKSMVLTNEEGWMKRGYASDIIRPKFAVMNPELTFTLPMRQTTNGIVDIMMHTMERYFTPVQNVDLIDRMSEALIKSVVINGKKVFAEPLNYDARAEIMWAGSLSHNDLLETGRYGDYSCHQLEHEVGGIFDVDHGAGLSALWSSWARYVYKEDIDRFLKWAVRVWNCEMDYSDPEATVLEGIKKTEDFFRSLGMPTSLKELLSEKGISELTEEQMHKMAQKSTYGGKRQIGRFKVLSEDDMVAIYKAAWNN